MALESTFLVLAVGMVITGSVNTITAKLADIQNSEGVDGTSHAFDHPFFQAVIMFLGEFLCIIAYRIQVMRKKQRETPEASSFNPAIFILPACCDLTATSCMYIGLNWTYASVFQMLRGSVVIFTGIFSVIFLKRKLRLYHWLGMFFVLVGLMSVGLASVLGGNSGSGAPHPLEGNIIIIAAQIVVAVQMVVEEKFIGKFDVPALQVVGWEGTWGALILSLLLIPFYYLPALPGASGDRFEDTIDAFVQIGHNWIIPVALLGNLCSIAFFNFFGISITKYASATTRTVLDSVRTVLIWGFSLAVGWQEFELLQLLGFVVLLLGTCIYNEILVINLGHSCLPESFANAGTKSEDAEKVPLLSPPDGTTVQ